MEIDIKRKKKNKLNLGDILEFADGSVFIVIQNEVNMYTTLLIRSVNQTSTPKIEMEKSFSNTFLLWEELNSWEYLGYEVIGNTKDMVLTDKELNK